MGFIESGDGGAIVLAGYEEGCHIFKVDLFNVFEAIFDLLIDPVEDFKDDRKSSGLTGLFISE